MINLQAVNYFYYVNFKCVAAECFDLKRVSVCKLSRLIWPLPVLETAVVNNNTNIIII